MPAGGAGGLPNGNPGADGEQGSVESSSNTGGAGGGTPFGVGGSSSISYPNGTRGTGYGAGGGGASAPNGVDPLNWTGGDGSFGLITVYWGPKYDPNYTNKPY